jgi:hypothetical protein
MARSTGLAPRRGYTLDAATVLVGPVAAGARGRAATTRTGAEQLLNTRLEAQDVFKLVVHGNASAAGQYTIQVAHVPEGSTTPSTYGTIALVTCAPGIQEIPISGAVVREIARTAPNPDVTGDVRVVAIQAVAGADANAPAGVNTISVQYA